MCHCLPVYASLMHSIILALLAYNRTADKYGSACSHMRLQLSDRLPNAALVQENAHCILKPQHVWHSHFCTDRSIKGLLMNRPWACCDAERPQIVSTWNEHFEQYNVSAFLYPGFTTTMP